MNDMYLESAKEKWDKTHDVKILEAMRDVGYKHVAYRWFMEWKYPNRRENIAEMMDDPSDEQEVKWSEIELDYSHHNFI